MDPTCISAHTALMDIGSVASEIAAFDLCAHLNDTVNMLEELADAQNLALLLEVSPDLAWFVRSYPGKIREALTNVVANAIKYTLDDGPMLLLVKTNWDAGSLVLCLEVEDTGIGIAEQHHARIFERFVQLGAGRTRKGTGLGLSITRHFVELLRVATIPAR